jgi:hypothetical protein
MAQRYLLLLLLSLLSVDVGAQHTISGNVSDTLAFKPLPRASIVLIRAKDSILANFTRTDTTGAFSMRADSSGKYILLISYPGYADYIEGITVDKDLIIPAINLSSRAHVLQEIVFKKKAAAIMIKGDTTEYAADSFALRSGASVEELIKKLPGLQVDKDGKITAMGEQVQKVLVDGEEFFSDDPAVVTKSLQAAIVDKVQVYDKKSDQAIFTGIDDGEKTKTINLTLKEDKKKGLFGKAVAGGGPSLSPDQHNGFFENEAMVNLFKGKQQISAFGIMSNTGTTGLSWGEREKYGSGSGNREYDEESGMIYSFSSDDGDELGGGWSGKYGGEGLPTVWTGGLHYANKWAKDKQHLSGNYRFSKSNIEADGSTTTQYILPDSQYVRNDTRSTFRTSNRHGGDGLYEWAIDTSSNIKLAVGGDYTEKASNGFYTTATRGASGGLINTNVRSTLNNSTSESMNGTLTYRKKFAKKGRNLSAEIRMNNKSSDGTGFLESHNKYYNADSLGSDSINQRKTNSSNNFSLNGQFSYTEPLSKVSFLTLRYGARATNSLSERFSFNRAGSEWSDTPDSTYSSSYGYDVFTQNGAASLRFVFKKYNFALGGEIFHTSWQQRDRFSHKNDRSRDYNNFAPTASLKYTFNKQSNISFTYSGRTNQPTIEQLQPLQQNTDPLNISVGNPDLRQEFSNNLGISFHSYKPLSGSYVYLSGNGGFTKDDIVREESFTPDGVHYSRYVNINGNWNAWVYGGYSYRIKSLDMSVGFNGNVNASHSNSFINGLKNTSQNNEYNMGVELEKNWKKGDKEKVSLSIYPHLHYQDNQASISTYANSFWSGNVNADFFAELPWKLQLRSELWYDYRQQTTVFNTNNNVTRWDASLGRKFLKGDKLELRAAVYDILNQNLGYNRNAEANYITEDKYSTIRRRLLFSLTYMFSGGAGTVKNDDDDD